MSQLTDWVVSQLDASGDILTPVKQMWSSYSLQNPAVSLDVFTRDLREDLRIEFIEVPDQPEDSADSAEVLAEEEAAMEAFGYFSGPRIKLKSSVITAEYIAKMIAGHTNRAIENLMSAYNIRPDDLDEQSERGLFEAIERSAEFVRRTRQIDEPDEVG